MEINSSTPVDSVARSSKITTTITVSGRISCDSDKRYMLDSTKAIADWSLIKPGYDDVYKTVTVKATHAGKSQKYEFSNVFAISYSEQFDDQGGSFKLVMRPVKSIKE